MGKKRNITGFIDKILPKRVSGWVVQEGQTRPVPVELWINGEKVKAQRARFDRLDIMKVGVHETGKCGFKFPKLPPLKRSDQIVVKAGGEKVVLPLTKQARAQSEKLPKRQEKRNLIPTEKGYYFIHIPKTAGTSFRVMLYELFAPSEIVPNVFDLEKNGGGYPEMNALLLQKQPNELKMMRLLAGHYPYQPMRYFEHQPKSMVFLRDPLGRAASNLFHLKRRHTSFFNSTFEEIFEQSPRQISNMQVRYLAGRLQKKQMRPNDLEIAKKRLKNIDFIGMTEEFETSIDYLEATFGWKFRERLQRNVNNSLKLDDLNPDLIEKIKEANKLDQELYNLGLKLFKQRLKVFKNKSTKKNENLVKETISSKKT